MDYVFNRCVAIDIFYLRGLPALSIEDIPSTFGKAVFLRSERAADCWSAFYRNWVLTYVGPPVYVVVDRGPQLVSEHFVKKCNKHGIQLIPKGTEGHWQWGAGERWHSKVRNVYNKAYISAAQESYSADDLLALSVFCVNGAPTDAGVSPVLTTFGQLPRLLVPHELGEFSEPVSNAERHAVLNVARSTAEAAVSRERYLEMLRRAPPSDPEGVASGDLVFVWREKGQFAGKSKKPGKAGPFVFLHRMGNLSWVLVDGKPWSVASTHVIPATADDGIPDERAMDHLRELASKPRPRERANRPSQQPLQDLKSLCCNVFLAPEVPDVPTNPPSCSATHVFAFDNFRKKCKKVADAARSIEVKLNSELKRLECPATVHVTKVVTTKDKEYSRTEAEAAMAEELDGLLETGALVFVHEDDVAPGSNVIGTRMIVSLKHAGTLDEMWKARLVTQGCLDREAQNVVVDGATVAAYSIRIIIAIAIVFGWTIRSKDARRAYLQGDDLSRPIFARLPKELRKKFSNFLFKIVKPVYGLKEAGAYWFAKYVHAWMHFVSMVSTALDVCLLYCRPGKELEGIVGIQVDDTLMAGTASFARAEHDMHKHFDMGTTQELSKSSPLKFSGCTLEQVGNIVKVHQTDYVGQLGAKKLKPGVVPTLSEVKAGAGALGWASSQTRPTASFHVSCLNQITASTLSTSSAHYLNRIIADLLETKHLGIVYPELDLESIYVAAYGDASLAGNDDLSSQMGGIVCLRDAKGNCSLLHWYSKKCPRIVSSILAGETIACVTTFDFAFAIRHTLSEILGRDLDLFLFTDSYSLFSTVTKYQCVREKRLMIDLSILRQAYRSGEATNFGFVASEYMIADPLTKDTSNPLLDRILSEGKLEHPVAEYVADMTSSGTAVDVSVLFANFSEEESQA